MKWLKAFGRLIARNKANTVALAAPPTSQYNIGNTPIVLAAIVVCIWQLTSAAWAVKERPDPVTLIEPKVAPAATQAPVFA